MTELEYQVSFATPAFLGNADQNAQWRTPPFKALLRQWWRVAYAADKRFRVDVEQMRREEGLLSGNAWLSHREGNRDITDHRKSLVRIRLDEWGHGKETKDKWGRQDPSAQKVPHPEVGNIGPLLYLGYGPLDAQKVDKPGGKPEYLTVLKRNAAVQAGAGQTLSVAVPDDQAGRFGRALWLIDRYGTLGGRSRNGWGAIQLQPLNEQSRQVLEGHPLPLCRWNECLSLDWSHAIGSDDQGRPLIWQTAPHADWQSVMRELAIVKIGLRTQFTFPQEKPDGEVHDRHWLSYPITKHKVNQWSKSNLRLPNSLRLKVRPAREDAEKLVGVIFHMPCRPPQAFSPDKQAIERTWKCVHSLLDELTQPPGSRKYESVEKEERRAQLRPQLDTLVLQRIGE